MDTNVIFFCDRFKFLQSLAAVIGDANIRRILYNADSYLLACCFPQVQGDVGMISLQYRIEREGQSTDDAGCCQQCDGPFTLPVRLTNLLDTLIYSTDFFCQA